jgi:hypothetical protein
MAMADQLKSYSSIELLEMMKHYTLMLEDMNNKADVNFR